jgi:hypothetical protein
MMHDRTGQVWKYHNVFFGMYNCIFLVKKTISNKDSSIHEIITLYDDTGYQNHSHMTEFVVPMEEWVNAIRII